MDFFTKKVSAAVTGLESKLDSVLLGDNNANNNNVDSSTSAAGDSEKKGYYYIPFPAS